MITPVSLEAVVLCVKYPFVTIMYICRQSASLIVFKLTE